MQRHAAAVCQQHIRLKDGGPKTTAAVLWAVLCYACARITPLAAACASLREAPSDTAAHDALLATLPGTAELQRRLNRARRARAERCKATCARPCAGASSRWPST